MMETLATLKTVKANLEKKKTKASMAVQASRTESEQSFNIGKLIGIDNCLVEISLAIEDLENHIDKMLDELEDDYAVL